MNATFLVELADVDLGSLTDIADEINDDLTQSGFNVISVAPWARPALQATQPIIVPTQQIQPNQET